MHCAQTATPKSSSTSKLARAILLRLLPTVALKWVSSKETYFLPPRFCKSYFASPESVPYEAEDQVFLFVYDIDWVLDRSLSGCRPHWVVVTSHGCSSVFLRTRLPAKVLWDLWSTMNSAFHNFHLIGGVYPQVPKSFDAVTKWHSSFPSRPVCHMCMEIKELFMHALTFKKTFW